MQSRLTSHPISLCLNLMEIGIVRTTSRNNNLFWNILRLSTPNWEIPYPHVPFKSMLVGGIQELVHSMPILVSLYPDLYQYRNLGNVLTSIIRQLIFFFLILVGPLHSFIHYQMQVTSMRDIQWRKPTRSETRSIGY